MAASLFLEPTRRTPMVAFDVEHGTYRIQGHSIPEDALGFYEPIYRWLEENIPLIEGAIDFEVSLKDFNTASRKCMLYFLKIVDSQFTYNQNIKITWVCEEDDPDMEETGEDFKELVEVPIYVLVRAL
jgi:SiaC family regulatory phosphoprotein